MRPAQVGLVGRPLQHRFENASPAARERESRLQAVVRTQTSIVAVAPCEIIPSHVALCVRKRSAVIAAVPAVPPSAPCESPGVVARPSV